MNKGNIVEELAKIVGSKNMARAVVDTILSQIKDALKRNDVLTISGFGSFKVVKRNARMGINPQTGEAMKFKARSVPRFAAGKILKAEVNSVRD